MRTIPPDLQAHLDTGATTLCWCWRLTRRDGTRQGFTDHDRTITFDGTGFEAAAGFSSSEIVETLGLGTDNLDVEGALSSAQLSDEDLEAGLYDDAAIEIFRVNWSDPQMRVLVRTGTLGEVKRRGPAFRAEVRGLSHYLQQPRGRLYQYTCDADVGDARCAVDLDAPAFRGTGAVVSVEGERSFTASGLGGFASGWFSRGLLTFTSGAAAGQKIEVRVHTKRASTVTFEVWQPVRQPLLAGQTFFVTAGCDKHLATCKSKFANVVNFRGFPHMPGNDFLTAVSRPGEKAR